MRDTSEISDLLRSAYNEVEHDANVPAVDCPACSVGEAVDKALFALEERDACIEQLQQIPGNLSLEKATVEAMEEDLRLKDQYIDNLGEELDAQRQANDTLRGRLMAEMETTERLSADRENLRSQRDALLAANEELHDVIRALV